MTTTDRPTRRVTRGEYRTLRAKAARIVVQVGPGDVITLHEERTRTCHSIRIPDLILHLVRRRFI